MDFCNKFTIHISVRNFVEFLLKDGDIDNRYRGGSEMTAMQEGTRIHKLIQGKMGSNYEAEVPLFFSCEKDDYILMVEGRADGIITTEEGVIIDEIKGTYRRLEYMQEPDILHVAQARCYAYMYARDMCLDELQVRITYCNMETEEIRYFFENFSFEEIEQWFNTLVNEYHKWAVLQCRQYIERQESIQNLEFPFEYRTGQRELAIQVYQTINQKKKLFLEAPTGVGKTITTLFPAVKAIGQGKADVIFYLTAKTITRTVAQETYEILRSKGLKFRSITITAKDKTCILDHADCNPDACERARGHYDRRNDALYALLSENPVITREKIEEYAAEYMVCPYELSLDASLFADGIICDYNYVFDPTARLQRFFGDGTRGNYIFLIDEAHNLLERGREMYSASLFKNQMLELKRNLKQQIVHETVGKNEIEGQLSLMEIRTPMITEADDMTDEEADEKPDEKKELSETLKADRDSVDTLYLSSGKKKRKGGKSILVKKGYADNIIAQLEKINKVMLGMKRECDDGHCVVDILDPLVKPINRLYSIMSDYLEERETKTPDVSTELLDMFFEVAHFLETYEVMDDKYVSYGEVGDDGNYMIKLFCTNPRERLKECMGYAVSTILFSATFLPIQYYKQLLGGDSTDYEAYAKSVFDPRKCGVYIASDVTSKYTRRTDDEFSKICEYIDEIVHAKPGNYFVFCPSHAFMRRIFEEYTDRYLSDDERCIIQQEVMTEEDREDFLDCFNSDVNVTAFGVLGGIFGEGIDLKEDKLIGAIIVGTGLPQVCFERELLKKHFDEENQNGYDYAYRFPGMNKVLQAAGRVIRTEEDRGIIALLDERFYQNNYQKLFPREWVNAQRVSVFNVADRVYEFWKYEN